MKNKKLVPPLVERPRIVFEGPEPEPFWDAWLLLRLSVVLNIVLILYIVQSVPNA